MIVNYTGAVPNLTHLICCLKNIEDFYRILIDSNLLPSVLTFHLMILSCFVLGYFQPVNQIEDRDDIFIKFSLCDKERIVYLNFN